MREPLLFAYHCIECTIYAGNVSLRQTLLSPLCDVRFIRFSILILFVILPDLVLAVKGGWGGWYIHAPKVTTSLLLCCILINNILTVGVCPYAMNGEFVTPSASW